MSFLIGCVLVILTGALIIAFCWLLADIYDYHKAIKEIMREEKYINLSYKKAVTLDKIGIEISPDRNDLFFFEKPVPGRYSGEAIYILLSYIDFWRFNSYRKKKKKQKQKNEIKKNESKEGYEYLLNELKKYADDCQGKADECFSESKRMM